MARIFVRVIVAVMLVSTAMVVGAGADETTILLCQVLLPPTPMPPMPTEMKVGACQASAGADGVCPPEGTSCAEAIAAILSRPGFKLKGQSPSGFGGSGALYTIVNPHASH